MKVYVLQLLSLVPSEMISLQYQWVLRRIGPEIVLLFCSGVGVGVYGGGGGVLSASKNLRLWMVMLVFIYELLEKMPMPVVEFSEEF